ncbi:MAG TPA: HAD family hydrolase [Dehalococcoidia bacterium]|nr:HAD family hydrolase [Dehalococcoidia bacterium]
MAVEAVLFDLDATLVDYDDAAYALTVQRVCLSLAALYPLLDVSRLAETHSGINRQIWQLPAGQIVQASSGAKDGHSIWREVWQQTLEACGCHDSMAADRAVDLYERDRRASYRLFDDVLETLQGLHRRVAIAVVTNGPGETQRDKLRATGIERYTDAIVASGEVGVAKPNAAVFQVALNALGVTPANAWHVGDSLALDVAGAHNAGLTSVWLNRTGAQRDASHPQPHHEIASLWELTGLLESEA